MKRIFLAIIALLTISALAACGTGGSNGGSEKEGTIVIGASNTPHAEILEKAEPLLEKKGVKLKIIKFKDYVMPNKSLASKELDANYFQHIPYLKSQMAENKNYDFVNAGGIHIEPIGVYSKKYKKLEELPDNAQIIMSNSVADHGRMLSLLESKGLIKLKPGIDKTTATVKDIAENPKNIQFKTDVEASFLPQAYKSGEGDAVLINTNYAISAGLNPMKDAIALEGADSPYVNIIAVRKGDENRKEIKTLVEVLHSKEIQDFIKEKYKGAVVPVNG
ncbi:MetQ/NlpA family ABC transporter substrate-binding protein [Metabacillus sp. GX 13764]|uniref:MetQ/NlpA family ABC transporter substrate-binding protein n=1 Tax=Metabacillus kandeliae TaxID=2900151 RepID=UPI001E5FF12E|nr:MetQ/NlpA family ABC transporter substrate-binding protein [Metabacillus kandeliae]MCD7036284.1 MetQ/NlpA family ABC transporter substrate-binding protein [Metabacillus kandeliae]